MAGQLEFTTAGFNDRQAGIFGVTGFS